MLIENKQRIVGIVVLVIFIALLIPFLFAGGNKKDATNQNPDNNLLAQNSSQQSPQSESLPPEMTSNQTQSIAIEAQGQNQTQETPVLTNSHAAPVQNSNQANASLNESLETAASPMVNQKNVVSPTIPIETTTKPIPAVAPESSNQHLTTAINASQAPVPTQETVPVVSQPAELVAPAVKEIPKNTKIANKPVVTIPKHKAKEKIVYQKANLQTATKEYWSVQIGSFADQKHVQTLVKNIRAKGYHVIAEKVSTKHGTLTRVLVGQEYSKTSAKKIAVSLEKSMHLNGQIVRIQK